MLRKILLFTVALCVNYLTPLSAGYLPICADGSIFCHSTFLNLQDLLPETATQRSLFRKATTTHNQTCTEMQIYRSPNVNILQIRGRTLLQLVFDPHTKPLFDPYCGQVYTQTSGAVYTQQGVTKREDGSIILHGAISVRARMPDIIPGAWPAIWMLPKDTAFTDRDGGASSYWPQSGEIDIVEMAGSTAFAYPKSTFLTTLHFGNTPGGDIPRGYFFIFKNIFERFNLGADYHIYSLEWNIYLKNDTSVKTWQLSQNNVAAIQLTGYIDGQVIESEKRNWNSYSPAPGSCDNGEIATGKPSPNSCGKPIFTIPDNNFPIDGTDAITLQTFINGFNSGFRLIMNLASGGPIFTGDPVGLAGAKKPLDMLISDVQLSIIDNLVFTPSIGFGGVLSWLPLSIPGMAIDHFQVTVRGENLNFKTNVDFMTRQLVFPANTFVTHKLYNIVVTAIDVNDHAIVVGSLKIRAP